MLLSEGFCVRTARRLKKKRRSPMEKVEFLLQALRDIEEVGSRHIYQSFEGDNGWEKKLVKIDRSIEAEMAHDALASFEQWGEYV
jgi:hypothetical protein